MDARSWFLPKPQMHAFLFFGEFGSPLEVIPISFLILSVLFSPFVRACCSATPADRGESSSPFVRDSNPPAASAASAAAAKRSKMRRLTDQSEREMLPGAVFFVNVSRRHSDPCPSRVRNMSFFVERERERIPVKR